jgi:hypothetical protein
MAEEAKTLRRCRSSRSSLPPLVHRFPEPAPRPFRTRKSRDGPRSPRIVRPGCLEAVEGLSARRNPPKPARWNTNPSAERCRDRRWFRPPGRRASVPCDRPGDRRCGTGQCVEKTPRSCSPSLGSPSQPFPPSFGPKSGKGSAPGSFRYRAVPRASTVLHPRPSRKHPPELACRSRRFGSGGSSSLLNQSQST